MTRRKRRSSNLHADLLATYYTAGWNAGLCNEPARIAVYADAIDAGQADAARIAYRNGYSDGFETYLQCR